MEEVTVRFTTGYPEHKFFGEVIPDNQKHTFVEIKGKTHQHIVANVKRRAKKNDCTGWKIYRKNDANDQFFLELDRKYA
jgi:hypothetical protein